MTRASLELDSARSCSGARGTARDTGTPQCRPDRHLGLQVALLVPSRRTVASVLLCQHYKRCRRRWCFQRLQRGSVVGDARATSGPRPMFMDKVLSDARPFTYTGSGSAFTPPWQSRVAAAASACSPDSYTYCSALYRKHVLIPAHGNLSPCFLSVNSLNSAYRSEGVQMKLSDIYLDHFPQKMSQ